MTAVLRTAVRALIVFALLAAASCSAQTPAGLADGTVAKATASSKSCGKKSHKEHKQHKDKKHCKKPKHEKRHWKPQCHCQCSCTPDAPANQPPVAAVALATVNGQTFELRPEGSSDPDGTLVQYEWDFESDGVYDAISLTDGVVSHTFFGGPHTVTLRVTDNQGATANATFNLVANFSPIAKITVVGTGSTPDGLVTYELSFADSSDVEGPIFMFNVSVDGVDQGLSDLSEHLFVDVAPADEHIVILTVIDGLDVGDSQMVILTPTTVIYAEE